MKKLIVLFAVGSLFIACAATRSVQNSQNNDETSLLYKIKKIKNEKSFYTIYAERNDSTFKVISNVVNLNTLGCEKIKPGNFYNLDLKVIFPSDSLFGKSVAPNLGVKGYKINNDKVVMLEKESHNKIYIALNLYGLCIKQ